MSKTILKSDFPCIFSINGALHEEGEISLDDDRVYYVTALPLSSVYVAYTVKLIGVKPQSNRDLCICVQTETKRYLLFSKRYHYVYSPRPYGEHEGMIPSFFASVKHGNTENARSFLAPDLSDSVSSDSLESFFAPFDIVVKAEEKNKWLLASSQTGKGELFTFALENGKIKDISSD